MLTDLFCAFGAAFFAIGFVFCAYLLMRFVSRPRGGRVAVAAFLPAEPAEAEALLARLLAERQLSGDPRRVFAVCEDGDRALREAVAAAFPNAPGLTICERSGLAQALGGAFPPA